MRYPSTLLTALLFGLLPLSAQAANVSTASPPAAAPAAEAAAPAKAAMSEAERAATEEVIRDYLVNKHPEVIMEAMKELQHREQATAEAKAKEGITTNKEKIFNDPNTPVGGNPKGDVTVVEFFDYQCGYCKMSEESVEKLLKEDKNVKFLYKDFPILGPMSTVAAKASFASAKQGKYIKFHDALMAKKDHLSEDMIYSTAKEAGLDVEKLKKDMADDSTQKLVDGNLKLGSDIGVRGTPMFIIGGQTYPGALQYEQMKQAVAEARAPVPASAKKD